MQSRSRPQPFNGSTRQPTPAHPAVLGSQGLRAKPPPRPLKRVRSSEPSAGPPHAGIDEWGKETLSTWGSRHRHRGESRRQLRIPPPSTSAPLLDSTARSIASASTPSDSTASTARSGCRTGTAIAGARSRPWRRTPRAAAQVLPAARHPHTVRGAESAAGGRARLMHEVRLGALHPLRTSLH